MKLIIQPTPHLRSKNSTAKIMLNVVIAALPAMAASVHFFGSAAATLIAVCVASCVIFEAGFRRLIGRSNSIDDLSAVVTGVILALNLPPTLPPYLAVIGSFVAIVVTKEMFGGLGQNFANPAAVGRIVLMLSFPAAMSVYAAPYFFKDVAEAADAVTAATPLAMTAAEMPSLWDLFVGNHAGSLGETSAAALLIGFVYLLAMRIIRPITPVAFVTTIAVGTYLLTGDLRTVLETLLTGGILLGAVFMVTDYVTNPMSALGKIIFGVGCGIISVVIRQYGGMPEGVIFAILTMNVLTPTIDRLSRPRPFGTSRRGTK